MAVYFAKSFCGLKMKYLLQHVEYCYEIFRDKLLIVRLIGGFLVILTCYKYEWTCTEHMWYIRNQKQMESIDSWC